MADKNRDWQLYDDATLLLVAIRDLLEVAPTNHKPGYNRGETLARLDNAIKRAEEKKMNRSGTARY